jgi:FkbM family methyltransferase
MCETLYQRARADDADVVIADANVFYENSKSFGQFFDQHIRKVLPAELRTMPFDLAFEPRALLLEPVAWTKLYRRSFLEAHRIRFEDGMNSYEDVCFHFSVLVKAKRISLIDQALFYYRQNRPGQISGRTNRKIFEVFDVFRKINENLRSWQVSPAVWEMFVKVQLRQFDWLLRDRVQSKHKREFLGRVAEHLGTVPEAAFQDFARNATVDELARMCCMRRNWLRPYERVVRHPGAPLALALAYLDAGERRRGALTKGARRAWELLRGRVISTYRAFLNKSLRLAALEEKVETVEKSVSQMIDATLFASSKGEVFTPHKIRDQIVVLAKPSPRSNVSDAVWRMQFDYYLTQTAAMRERDVVVDIGAHVGAVAIYLAKKYPFIRVIAIEPEPHNYACLVRNIEANGVTNVVAINKAISGDGRDRTLYIDDRGWATLDAEVATTLTAFRTVRTGTLTLEQLFEDQRIRYCRVLKITAPGVVGDTLGAFARRDCVDLLCGEVDLADCSTVKLEAASWRISRQHFWRTIDARMRPTAYLWNHRAPGGIERLPAAALSTLAVAEPRR